MGNHSPNLLERQADSDFPHFEIHPAALLMPPMLDCDYQALKTDIAERGQLDDICVFKGQILDGRHRYRACRELNIRPEFCEIENCDNPVAYVLSKNLFRRHLTSSQRAMVAAQASNLRHGSNQHAAKVEVSNDTSSASITIDDAAKAAQVSAPSVKRARKIIDKGDSIVAEAVTAGEITVGLAAKLVEVIHDKEEQHELVLKGSMAVKDRIYEVKHQQANKQRAERCQKTKKELAKRVKDNRAFRHDIETLPPDTTNPAYVIRRHLQGRGLIAAPNLAYTKRELAAAYVNCSQSALERAERLDFIERNGEAWDGQSIMTATLNAMVWLGVVIRDGDGPHTAYRLADDGDDQAVEDESPFSMGNCILSLRKEACRWLSKSPDDLKPEIIQTIRDIATQLEVLESKRAAKQGRDEE